MEFNKKWKNQTFVILFGNRFVTLICHSFFSNKPAGEAEVLWKFYSTGANNNFFMFGIIILGNYNFYLTTSLAWHLGPLPHPAK